MSEQHIDYLKKKLRKTRSDAQSPERVRLTLDQIAARVNNLIERRDPNAAAVTHHHEDPSHPSQQRRAKSGGVPQSGAGAVGAGADDGHRQRTSTAHKYHVTSSDAPITPQKKHEQSNNKPITPPQSRAVHVPPQPPVPASNAVVAAGAVDDEVLARSAHYIGQLESELETLLVEREKICSMLYRSAARETRLELAGEEAAQRMVLMQDEFEHFADLTSLHSRRLQLHLLRSLDAATQLSKQLQEETTSRRRESPAIAASAAQAVVLNDLKKCIDDVHSAIRGQVVQSSQRVEEAVCGKISAAQNIISKAIELSRSAAVNDLGELRRMLEVEIESRVATSGSSGGGRSDFARDQSPIESIRADRERDRLLAEHQETLQVISKQMESLLRLHQADRAAGDSTKSLVEVNIGKVLGELSQLKESSAASCRSREVEEIVKVAAAQLLRQLRHDQQEALATAARQRLPHHTSPPRQEIDADRTMAVDMQVQSLSTNLTSRIDELVALVRQQQQQHHLPSALPADSRSKGDEASSHLQRYLAGKFSGLISDSVALEASFLGEKLDHFTASVGGVVENFIKSSRRAERSVSPPQAHPKANKSPRSQGSSSTNGSSAHVRNVFELPPKNGPAVQQVPAPTDLPPPPAMRPLLQEFSTVQHMDQPSAAVYASFSAPFVPTCSTRRTPAKLQNIATLKLLSGVIDPSMMTTTAAATSRSPSPTAHAGEEHRIPLKHSEDSRHASPPPPMIPATDTSTIEKAHQPRLVAESSFRNHSPVPLCPVLLSEAQNANVIMANHAHPQQHDDLLLGNKSAQKVNRSSSTSSSTSSTSSSSASSSKSGNGGAAECKRSSPTKQQKPAVHTSRVTAKSPSTSSLSLESIDATSPVAASSSSPPKHQAARAKPTDNDFDRPASSDARVGKTIVEKAVAPPLAPPPPLSVLAPLVAEQQQQQQQLGAFFSLATTPKNTKKETTQRRSSFDSLLSSPSPQLLAQDKSFSERSNSLELATTAAAPATVSLAPPNLMSVSKAATGQSFTLEAINSHQDDKEKGRKKIALPSW